MTADFPTDGVELTHILVVSDLERARAFYTEVLGATLYREYGGTSCVLTFQGVWLLLVTGGGPTRDKPQVTFAPPESPDTVPVDWGHEIRCFFRDPDGHLFEISQVS
jgi:catechol 2,3-dioxygenase-like lactoylglutathione lyase family enzyme